MYNNNTIRNPILLEDVGRDCASYNCCMQSSHVMLGSCFSDCYSYNNPLSFVFFCTDVAKMVLTRCLGKKLNEKTIVYDFEFLEDYRPYCVQGADEGTDTPPTDDFTLTSVKSGPTSVHYLQMPFSASSNTEGDISDPLWPQNTQDDSPQEVPHKVKGYSFCHTSILKGHFSSHPLTLMVS